MTDQTHRATDAELRQYVEQFEAAEAQKKDIADHQKEIMATAKAKGYDTAILRKVIAMRKKSADELAEEAAILDLYLSNLGMS